MAGSLEGMDKRPSLNQECITPSKCNFKQTLKRWVVLDIHLGGNGSAQHMDYTYITK